MKKLLLIFLLLPILGFAQGFQTKTDTIHFLNQNKVIALGDTLNKKLDDSDTTSTVANQWRVALKQNTISNIADTSKYIEYSDTGTTANKIIKLDGAAKLPAVNASQLTNLPSAGFDPTTTVELMEEFVGGTTTSGQIGQYGWRFATNNVGTISSTVSSSGKIGIIKVRSGASAGSFGYLYLANIEGGAIILGNQGGYTSIISVANSQAANAEATLSIGLITTGAVPVDGVYFKAIGTGNWFAVTRAANVDITTNTNIAQSTSFKTFKMVMNSAGTSVEFFIDGISKAIHTTNIPTAVLYPLFQIETSSATQYSLDTDYFYLKITGLTR